VDLDAAGAGPAASRPRGVGSAAGIGHGRIRNFHDEAPEVKEAPTISDKKDMSPVPGVYIDHRYIDDRKRRRMSSNCSLTALDGVARVVSRPTH
jgi:hypothetical protein